MALVGVAFLSIAPIGLAAGRHLLSRDTSPTSSIPPPTIAPAATQALSAASDSDEKAPTAGTGVTLRESRISVQTAVTRVCEAAGLKYAWQKSFDNTGGKSKLYISVDLQDVSVEEALDDIVVKNGLRYRMENGQVWLEP